jgi:hypothetical protein
VEGAAPGAPQRLATGLRTLGLALVGRASAPLTSASQV